MVARYGAPTIQDYRRVYEQSGVLSYGGFQQVWNGLDQVSSGS
ncbi:MAG: hypothetical protein ACRDTH_26860 [Pseudonocardiaceae bacterium]